jgi:hypothetical protein
VTKRTAKSVKPKDQLSHNCSLAVHGGALVVGNFVLHPCLFTPPLDLRSLFLLIHSPPPTQRTLQHFSKNACGLLHSNTVHERCSKTQPLYTHKSDNPLRGALPVVLPLELALAILAGKQPPTPLPTSLSFLSDNCCGLLRSNTVHKVLRPKPNR